MTAVPALRPVASQRGVGQRGIYGVVPLDRSLTAGAKRGEGGSGLSVGVFGSAERGKSRQHSRGSSQHSMREAAAATPGGQLLSWCLLEVYDGFKYNIWPLLNHSRNRGSF